MVLDDEHAMVDTIITLGHEGSYLKDKSTMKFFKQEHSLPDLFPRETFERLEARNQTEEALALERVNELLNQHEVKELSPEVVKEIDQIIAAAEKAYSS
jgi:trimethylamine:corrinoid methyltransferase-like protein